MKRVLVLFGLPLALALISTGCATSKPPMVDTWRNPKFFPTPADKIALTDHPVPGPQDAALHRLMVDELQREGFSVVSSDQADYLLAYVLDEAVQIQQVAHIHPQYNPMMQPGPLTPQTDAQYGATSRDLVTHNWTGPPPAPLPDRVDTFRFTSDYIRLLLYTNPQTHAGDFQLVWQGNIDVDQPVSAEREQLLLKTLLGYFGKSQNGRVNLSP